MTGCAIYYDLVRGGFPYWNVLWGIPVGLFLYLASRLFSKETFYGRQMRRGGVIALLAWCCFILIVLPHSFVEYQHLLSSVNHGDTSVAEGVVSHFIPTPQYGKRAESFIVNGKAFSYSPYEIAPGFHQAQPLGGPIKEGLPVRVSYVGDTIVRLEICDQSTDDKNCAQ